MQNENYTFYSQTTSLCEECLCLVPAKIIFQDNCVYFLKHCPTHKFHKTLISTDINYFKKSREINIPSVKSKKVKNSIINSCPLDCGLCEDHEQHTAMGIVEILDECNMQCPTCIGAFHPGAGKVKSVEEIERMLDTFLEYQMNPDIVMISGGEPTIHPEIIEILRLAYNKPFKHIMLITNGVKIAEDITFVKQLAEFKIKLEIYLQFDSLSDEVLMNIRGKKLKEKRIQSVTNLENEKIHSTLICIVKKTLNEYEMNDIIDFGLQFKYIRGVTFQPCKITGRNDSFVKEVNYITLSEVRQNILKDSPFFSENDFIPHPLNPENICIGYLHKKDHDVSSVTNFLFNEPLSARKYKLHFPFAKELREKMYFLPELNTGDIKYENLFRVTIVSFLDKFNFCTTSVKRSCIHFITLKKEIIPLDTYYLFYQNK
jgi:uncharacterized radical SAM superfamily Fe-S cluster-containing enzyme